MARTNQTHPDRASALVFLLLAIGVGVGAYHLNPGSLGRPGPGLTPLLYASVLATLALIQIFRAGRQPNEKALVLHWGSVLSILTILLIYGLLIERLGYLACTFIVMIFLFRLGKVGWPGSLLSAALATGIIHLLFVHWLAVPLPLGSIF